MVGDFQIVILDEFQPSSLLEVDLLLGEDVLEALVVGENLAGLPI